MRKTGKNPKIIVRKYRYIMFHWCITSFIHGFKRKGKLFVWWKSQSFLWNIYMKKICWWSMISTVI